MHVAIWFFPSFVEETILSQLSGLGTLVKQRSFYPICKGLFLGSLCCSIGLFVFLPLPHCCDHCGFLICFRIRKRVLQLLFFYKNIFTIQGPLRFHVKFKNNFSIFTKNAVGILIDYDESIDYFKWSFFLNFLFIFFIGSI